MLAITLEAKELIAQDGRFPSGRPLRLEPGNDGDTVDLTPTMPEPDDLTFSHLGRPLLVVAFDVARRLDGKELGVTRDATGPDLTLRTRSHPPPVH